MKIELLTPVHIGTGYEIPLYEWKNFNSLFVRIDFSKLDTNLLPSDAELTDNKELIKWKEKLKEEDLNDAVLYTASIHPKAVQRIFPAQNIREFIKNKFNNQPIIPGSSIKGAIITAYLYQRYIEKKWVIPVANNGKKLTNKAIEEIAAFFDGTNPEKDKSDISNRLKIGDLNFSMTRIKIGYARRIIKNRSTGKIKKIYSWLEYLSENQESVESHIAQVRSVKDSAPQMLPLEQTLVKQVCERCKKFAKAVIKAEIEYLNHYGIPHPAFYTNYTNIVIDSLSDFECLIRLGWASNRNAVSLTLLNSFPDLNEFPKGTMQRRPKSRWLLRGEEPLGWCKLTFDQSDWRTP